MKGKSANTRVSSRNIGSDLARVAAHVIGPEEYEELPEIADEDMARAVFSKGAETFPNPVRGRGQPAKEDSKLHVSVRLSPDVLDAFRAMGPGWQGRLNEAARMAQRAPLTALLAFTLAASNSSR